MDWIEREGTTGKVEPSTLFVTEEKFMTSLLTLSSTLIRHLFHTYPLESTHQTLKVLKTFPQKA